MWFLVYLVAHSFIRLLVSGGQQGQDGTSATAGVATGT
jgi:hypothetical protein